MFNFALNEEQEMLRKTVRSFLEDNCSTEFVRTMLDDSNGYSPKMWLEMAELGWLGLNIPEEYNGMGMSMVDLEVVMEQMGRAILPAPFLETVIASEALILGGNEVQKQLYLPRIASGELIATLAIDEPEGYWTAGSINAKAVQESDGLRVTGSKMFVPYAQSAGIIICAVRTAEGKCAKEGITLVILDPKAEGVSIIPLNAMDEAYRLCEVKLDGVKIPTCSVLGEAGKGWPILDKVMQKAAVLAAAEAVGGTEKALEMIVQYSKERIAFDKPIGSYQAIKHRCADIFVDMESTRGSVMYAAWAQQNGAADAETSASAAKANASDIYVNAAQKILQSFGGIGFTWEHDIHLFLKRARRLEMAYGDAGLHREKIASLWL
ncbi:MAG: acyl-CoA dehydrogenase family protein [Bacillota bacterium]